MNEHERVKELRNALGIKQGDFAKRISTTQGHISDIEHGRKSLSDRTVKLICLEFNVNEEWLKYGKGEMFLDVLPEDEIAAYCAQISAGVDPFIQSAIIEYMHLDEESKLVIKNLIRSISERMKKEETGE